MNPALSRDMTNADLSSHMGPVGAKSGLNVAFFWSQVRLQSANPDKNGKIENRLCVAKQPKGDPKTIVHRFITAEEASREFPREYALFTQFEDVPPQGTPLSELPGVSRSQIMQLDLLGLRCVEDLQDIQEEQLSGQTMDVMRAYKIAQKWLANREAGADVIAAATDEAKAAQALKNMKDRLQRVEAQNLRLQAENDALTRAGGRNTGVASASEPVARTNDEGLPYDLDDDDGFMAGGDVAVGGEDLGENDPDPLME